MCASNRRLSNDISLNARKRPRECPRAFCVLYTQYMPIAKIVGLILLVAALSGFLYLASSTPSNERTWIPAQARTAAASAEGTEITLQNVRDWTYSAEAVLDEVWLDLTVDTEEIVRVWFLIEPFSDFEAVGHTFLSFELEDGSAISFSVEARREEGEEYSAIKGQFRAYELSYQWGTERDFVTRRLSYLDHPLRLYPLELSPEAAQALFRSLAKETNDLATSPRFYNTLTANCTNVLANLVNEHYPGTLPYDISWNLTGYADRYLMDQGLIALKGTVEETQRAHDLTVHRDAVKAMATTSPTLFGQGLRALLLP